MAKMSITEKVSDIALPIVDSKGFELVDIEYVKEGPNWYLRVYIDKEGGITIEDCQVVSEELSQKLDQYDPIPSRYILEVSSPGIERKLKKDEDFERFKGSTVEVRLFKPSDDRSVFEGELLGLEDGKVIIKVDGDTLKFDKKEISLVKIVFKF